MRCIVCSSLAVALCLRGAFVTAQAAPPTAASPTPPAADVAPTSSAAANIAPLPLSATLQGEARDDYRAARILFVDQDFAGSLVKFQRAYERSGEPRLLWNMAACEKNLRHYAAVLRLLERYEREGAAHISPGHRAEFTGVLKTVRLLVSRVQLQVEPNGAHVFLDEVLVGTTPLQEPLLVDLGMRKIRIHKSGYKDHLITRNFSDASDVSFQVTLPLELHQGTLAVTARANDAIRVDGVLMGQGKWQGVLPSGEHSVRVAASGMRSFERQVFVEDDRTQSLYVTLESEPRSGISPWLWAAVGVVAASGIAVASYFALRPDTSATAEVTPGSWGTYPLP
jgi:hypothetical protein